MPEVMFVVKSIFIALIVTICMQIKVGTSTIETHALMWIQSSSISQYVQGVSSGGVLAIKNASKTVSGFISKTFGNDQWSQKAGRLNFDFKRSQKFEDDNQSKSRIDE